MKKIIILLILLSSFIYGQSFWIPPSTGGTGGTASEALDGTFRIHNTADTTKKLAFDASGITTSTTRTIVIADKNGTLAMISDVPTASAGAVVFDEWVGDGTKDEFVMSQIIVNPEDILVTIDGIIQTPTTDYTVSNDTLTFTTPPESLKVIESRLMSGAKILGDDRTVNFTSSMSAAEIQSLIDNLPRNLGGHTLIFQFADGTYSLNASLFFNGFYYGTIKILGNTGESGAHTNQAVQLGTSTTLSDPFISVKWCTARVEIENIKADASLGSNTKDAIYVAGCSLITIIGCYTTSPAAINNTSGIWVDGTNAFIYDNYVDGGLFGIRATTGAQIGSGNNYSTGTNPSYGLAASLAGRIGKYNATQPTGSTANEFTSGGGEIN